MKTDAPRRRTAGGFTLVEMLTTMAIVAILIGLLVPAFAMIRNAAMTVRQKAQFNAIGAGLESFRTDFGDYPPSNFYDPGFALPTDYCGAQKLAEAIVGWDGFGVHPKTEWRADGMADHNQSVPPTYELIYDVLNGVRENNTGAVLETPQDNRSVRKGPYLELESANAVKISDLYPAGNRPNVGGTALAPDTYVLADQFGKVTNIRTRKKTGMPILYFKANPTGFLHVMPMPMNSTNIRNLFYNVRDNRPFYFVPPPFALNSQHPLAQGEQAGFYVPTRNPNAPNKPLRSESYILLSAGKDGFYGTRDDVWNFETEQY